MNLFVVLPYTKNYKNPRSKVLKIFGTYELATEYANQWKCVEIIQTKM
jgi:hypothetical protein